MQQHSANENQFTFSWPRNNEFLGVNHDERQDIIGKMGEILTIAPVHPVQRPTIYPDYPDSPLRSMDEVDYPDSPLSSMDEVDCTRFTNVSYTYFKRHHIQYYLDITVPLGTLIFDCYIRVLLYGSSVD